jgi:hypothetical protein
VHAPYLQRLKAALREQVGSAVILVPAMASPTIAGFSSGAAYFAFCSPWFRSVRERFRGFFAGI